MVDVYYNDNDAFACEWLRNLARFGHLSHGAIDSRSIADIEEIPSDVVQAHFFAGIGGWPLALRFAEWPDNAEVWTGSCPCQPFSNAGRKRAHADERHLWPEWFRLIRECGPPVVFGEQVDSPLGRAWLDSVLTDLEGEGYACGAAVLPAAGVGAPHQRHRIYWVALADGERRERLRLQLQQRTARQAVLEVGGRGEDEGGLGDADEERRRSRSRHGASGYGLTEFTLDDASTFIGLGDAGSGRGGRDAGALPGAQEERRPHGREPDELVSPGWHDCEWVPCRDPKRGVVYRPVEPGSFPLAHGVSGRVGRLRAYGNAVVPEATAVFVRAVVESIVDR